MTRCLIIMRTDIDIISIDTNTYRDYCPAQPSKLSEIGVGYRLLVAVSSFLHAKLDRFSTANHVLKCHSDSTLREEWICCLS